jgi:hypothetical protein
MSGYTAFADVGDTLRKLLWESIKVDSRIYPDIVSSEDDLSMLSPEEMREGDSKKLSIFLYQITECPYLKNQEMEQTGSTNLKQIPLASILYYLVTPNTDDRRKDHVLLGKVMQILYDNATIRGSILQGALGGTRGPLNPCEALAAAERTLGVSLAVRLVDDYSGRAPVGRLEISTRNGSAKPIVNSSGYRVFTNLSPGEYQVRVQAEYYFDAQTTVRLTELDPSNPVIEISLTPEPSYPFPPGVTLIRGMVLNPKGAAVSGAEVRIEDEELCTETTAKGEFVLYFPIATEEKVVLEDGRRLVRGKRGKAFRLVVTHDSGTGIGRVSDVEEGKTNRLWSPITLG